jgi:hypothetical protein
MFPAAPAKEYNPKLVRDGYGRPLDTVFGLRISGTVDLTRPFETRRSGGVVEVFQARNRA